MDKANPFFHRGPIRDPAYFCGRRHETDQALALLRNAQSVSVVGPRRIGKTSLLFHLANPGVFTQRSLLPERYCFIYVDCEGWDNLKRSELYRLLLEEMNDALAAAGHQTVLTGRSASPITARTFEGALRAVVRQRVQPIFLLDEFEALSTNRHLDADFFSGLRGLATRHGVAYVTASSEPLLALTYARPSALSSPFFNFFAPIRLRPLQRAEAEGLLTRLVARGGGAFDPSTIDLLLDLAGPHPLLLQIAGYHAFELRAATGAPLDEADQRRVRNRFLAEAEAHWTYYWHNLSPHDQKLLALLPVAWRADPAAVQRLEGAGLVLRRDDEVIPLSPAFQAFVHRQAVPGLLQVPPVTLDPAQRIALLRDQPLSLTPTEFNLLACLVVHAGQVVPHRELESQVWHGEYVEDPERLKTAIKTLRRALGDDAGCIQNVRGVGYRFSYAT